MVIVALLCGIGVYFDFIYLALLPLLLMAAYLCYNKPFQYVLIICFCVPLSIFINDVGGGWHGREGRKVGTAMTHQPDRLCKAAPYNPRRS